MKNQRLWTSEEVSDLMEFVGEKSPTNIFDYFNIYAKENNRSVNATQYRYYTDRKKYFATKNQKEMPPITTEKGALSQKSWKHEETMNLKDYMAQGMSISDISDKLHRTVGAVNSRLYRMANKAKQEALSKNKETRIDPHTWAKQQGYVKESDAVRTVEVIKEVVVPGPSMSIMKGKQIRIPIINMAVENNELVISF